MDSSSDGSEEDEADKSGDGDAASDADEVTEDTTAQSDLQVQAQISMLQQQIQQIQMQQQGVQRVQLQTYAQPPPPIQNWSLPPPRLPKINPAAVKRQKNLDALAEKDGGKKGKKDKGKKKRASKLEFKRVDQLWDSTIHNYKLTDTAEDEESSEYDQYLFNVRRTFDWEGKYKTTVVDIKSKLLKEALNEVMDGVKGVSLVEETPTVDPNLLFLYLEDLRKAYKDLKNKKIKDKKKSKKDKKKLKKRNETKRAHLKVILKYLDKDYASVKKTLYPMLETGIITFDLLWALYKPNTLAFTTTYGSLDEPRAFKIELAEKEHSFMKGEWYSIEGRYLEYDGKTWGMGKQDQHLMLSFYDSY